MSIIAGTAIESALGGYQIERSLRFNSADSAYLNRTQGTPTDEKKFTQSVWLKRGKLSVYQAVIGGRDNATAQTPLYFTSGDQIGWSESDGVSTYYSATTTAVFRDPSAWYHIVTVYDSNNATAADRLIIYVNGVRQTITISGSGSSIPSGRAGYWNQSGTSILLGATNLVSDFFDGYLTEVNNIDGQALDPTSFGEYNTTTGVWQPIEYTGTYGTNGFYLNFSDNSGTTSTTLGKDYSGNGNNWTPNNFSVTAGVGNDSLVDTPTPYGTDTGAGGEVRGNYCTLNPLDAEFTITNGNLDATQATANFYNGRSTFAVSSGKWYYEATISSLGSSSILAFGARNNTTVIGNGYIGSESGDVGINSDASTFYKNNGTSNTSVSGSPTPTSGQILQCALDMDNGKVWFGVNGTWLESGNPSTATNPMFTGLSGTKSPAISVYNSSALNMNFGQRPFAYTAPSGFAALCTQNLPDPTIADGSQYFDVSLWTGDGSDPQAISGLAFQPDFVWAKSRSTATSHVLTDSVRGATKTLYSDTTAAETTADLLTAFNSDGFDVSTGLNIASRSLVGWSWKAGGSGVSNTDGTITSTVSANPTAGFSIVTYTGNGSSGTIGHGLGAAPSLIIVKNRTTAGDSWPVYSKEMGATYRLFLNTSGYQVSDPTGQWNGTAPTSTVFSVGSNSSGNGSGANLVAYCFAPILGYSAFGSYQGNGSADGSFIYLGFRPRYVMIKLYTSQDLDNWYIQDTSRAPYNVMDTVLVANADIADADYYNIDTDFLSNGFKIRSSSTRVNGSGWSYIYMAFAENPFKYALAR